MSVVILFTLLISIILILTALQIVTFELAYKKAVQTKNNGFFLALDKPYSYTRTGQIGFTCLLVYFVFSDEKTFSLNWFTYLLVFVAMGVISDAVVQYVVLHYGKWRCKKVIGDMKSLENEVNSFIETDDGSEEACEFSMPLYDEITISKKYLKPTDHLAFVSIDGGEFVKKFKDYPETTFDVEPFIDTNIVESNLEGLPVKVTKLTNDNRMPFKDDHIDMVINEYANYDKNEMARVLKKDGYFVLNAYGSRHLREFLEMYMPFALRGTFDMNSAENSLRNSGFEIIESHEDQGFIRFRNLKQLRTYFKKAAPDVSRDMKKFVNFYIEALREIKSKGYYEMSTYRFIVVGKLSGSYTEGIE